MALSWFDDMPGVIVIADNPVTAAVAEEAVAHAGGRMVATVPWAQAHDRIIDQAAPATLMVEATGVDQAVLEQVLPDLAKAVDAARIVIACSADQIDLINVTLLGSEAAQLCDASQAERIAALVMSFQPEALDVRDSREETARLARINAEVARFTETLARLSATPQGEQAAEGRDAIVGDRRTTFLQPGDDAVVTPSKLRRAIRARRLRDEVFGLPGLFEDPAWDMLLDLYAADLERRQVSVSSLCIAAAVAPTTALRWINKLIAFGLLERAPDAFDRRRAFVALTPRATGALRDYMNSLRRAGLSIA